MLLVKKLSKKYGKAYAIKDISFHVEKGQIFAFFGKNGAGKSTTMNILSTLIRASGGRFSIGGVEVPAEIRKKIGMVFQENTLDGELTVYQNLFIRGKLYGQSSDQLRERIHRLAREFSFESCLPVKFGILSGGQKRIVQIARALMGNPHLLILDEPTVGLDPQIRGQVWEVLFYLKKYYHMTIFFSSHYMEEARFCDQVCILDQGKIQCMETPENLIRMHTKYHLEMTRRGMREEFEPESPGEALRILKQQPAPDSFQFRTDTLDDIFVRLTDSRKERFV